MSASQSHPLPTDREALLSMVGVHKENIYQMVRQILDDMETAAPWEGLYYPPNDSQAFLLMETAFLGIIEQIPARLTKLTQSFLLEGMDPEAEQVLGDAEFFFGAIHDNVRGEILKLRNKLRALNATSGSIALTTAERAFTCEISADLKGKYASSIMGAAATLIASGLWNGVEIEPILFPEKLEEFQRNELLVRTLQEVVGNINNLLEELPLAELVAHWEKGQRVDQYALTTLYSFLGNLGKLMKGKCRRALYSGDYHQIQKRENLLSSRINELTTLHHVTWGTVPKEVVGGNVAVYPMMIQKATELATILDINILRKIIGRDMVQELLTIVTVEKEQQKTESRDNPYLVIEPQASPLRLRLPEHLRTLVPLLYDEDLQKFLSLLLGSVQKRASLEVTLKRARAGDAPAGPRGKAHEDDSAVSSLDQVDLMDEPELASPSPVFANLEPEDETPTFEAGDETQPVFVDPQAHLSTPAPVSNEPPASLAVPEPVFHGEESSVQISFGDLEPTDSLKSPDLSKGFAHLEVNSPLASAPEAKVAEIQVAEIPVAEIPVAEIQVAEPEFTKPKKPQVDLSGNSADEALDAALPSFGESTEVQPPPDFKPQIDVGQPVVPEASGIVDRPMVHTPSARDRPPTFTEPSATYNRPTFGPKDSPFEPKMSMDEVLPPLPDFDFPDLPQPDLPPDNASAPDPKAQETLETLKGLDAILAELLSPQNSHRKKFEMVHRLLQRRKTVPPSMLESMHPYLYDVLNMLVPQLHKLDDTPEMPPERATELIETCTFLCNKNMSPDQVKNAVLPTLAKFLTMLEDLSRENHALVERMSSDSMAS